MERANPIPLTAQRFFEQVAERARLTGTTFESAAESLLPYVSTEDLRRMADELLLGDTATRDAAGKA